LAFSATGANIVTASTNGVERLRITSAGNVGVGTSSPSHLLDVAGIARMESANIVKSEAGGVGPELVLLNSSNSSNTGNGGQIQFVGGNQSGRRFVIRSASTGTFGRNPHLIFSSENDIDGLTERLRITNAGNVGIGTASPDAKLTVNGAASFAAGTALLPSIARAGDLNTGIFFPAADTIAFSEGGAERMRIDSSGNVGIDRTSPNAKLDVNGLVRASGINFNASGGNNLDDYEEGTWTPVLGGDSQSDQTYNRQTGFYVKIGKLVYLTFTARLTNRGTITGVLPVISNLPFTCAGDGIIDGRGNRSALSIAFWENLENNFSIVLGLISQNSTRIVLSVKNTGMSSSLGDSDGPNDFWSNSTEIAGSIFYRTLD
jgi:hypothetical protein